MTRLVLASKSRARAAMLSAAGIAVELLPADIDERAFDARWVSDGLGPAEVAAKLAEAKAEVISLKVRDAVVIGADQTLALGERRFSKPKDAAQARAHLMAFRGRTHYLHSGVAIARAGIIEFSHVSSAAMTVRAFSDRFIDDYIAAMGQNITSSVGCYHFEGLGLQLFDRIEGDYFTILGMPMLPLLAHLRDIGIVAS